MQRGRDGWRRDHATDDEHGTNEGGGSSDNDNDADEGDNVTTMTMTTQTTRTRATATWTTRAMAGMAARCAAHFLKISSYSNSFSSPSLLPPPFLPFPSPPLALPLFCQLHPSWMPTIFYLFIIFIGGGIVLSVMCILYLEIKFLLF